MFLLNFRIVNQKYQYNNIYIYYILYDEKIKSYTDKTR